jgi:hypothetical protein
MYERAQMQELRRHPVRGALWGLVLGLGAALLLIGQKLIAFGTLPPIRVTVGGVVVGVLWAMYAPAKEPAGPPPVAQQTTSVGPDVHAGAAKWVPMADEPPAGGFGPPVGSTEVPGGEYAEPVDDDSAGSEATRRWPESPPPPPPPSFPPPPPHP